MKTVKKIMRAVELAAQLTAAAFPIAFGLCLIVGAKAGVLW